MPASSPYGRGYYNGEREGPIWTVAESVPSGGQEGLRSGYGRGAAAAAPSHLAGIYCKS